ncbi:YbgF trimerization domain-containing protein [Sphingomonas naphthae]|uniref:YbgF trimerization domain-containing protein n=1 Tax=Sphingomonas naphthae TaxID=1813468 RepID=A0ABY7TFS5_9SPHN|nr:tetratricopeptide repeat protein [Sphingomonas naphthae]WCT71908.1 YbgF trimerization domain-containing protein [Sphingomonas naphthae]
MRLALPIALLLTTAIAAPAIAQSAAQPIDRRVGQLEKEMRAVQRKVFPGGAGMTVEPEIQPNTAPAAIAGTPAGSQINDLTARVDTLERELARMTGQMEQNSFKVRQLEEAMKNFQANADGRLKALEGPPPEPSPFGAPTPAPGKPDATGTLRPPRPATGAPATVPAKPAPVAAAPAPKEEAPKVASTGDPGEDAYMAGYKLWTEKKYPEAATALKAMAAKYPKHKRASYAQNLLGRSYLDDGKPAAAAEAFYANYQTNPRGERAPDSLFFLGQSLQQLKKSAEACKVYDELQDVYGTTMGDALKARAAKARVDAKCS